MTLQSENGWLAPGGAFYPCGPGEHGKTIVELLNSTEEEALEAGWLRLASGEWFSKHPSSPVTFVQYGVLKDWHAANKRVQPEWIRKP